MCVFVEELFQFINSRYSFYFLGDHWIEIVTEDGSENAKGREKEIDWIATAAAVACDHLLFADHLIGVG